MTLKLDDPYICLENIKNTPRYWQQEKYVMNAKLENLGAFNVFSLCPALITDGQRFWAEY